MSIMAKSKCPGCKNSFTLGRSYTGHIKKCRAFRQEVKASLDTFREAKKASAVEPQDEQMEEEEAEQDLTIEEGPSGVSKPFYFIDSISNTCCR